MSRKSQETIGTNVDIRVMTESNAFQHERLLLRSRRAEEGYLVAKTYDQKMSIDTIV